MSYRFLRVLLAALIVCCTSLSATAVELKGWLREGAEFPQHQALQYFFDRLKTNSQGRFSGSLFCCDDMGQQKDVVPKFKKGEVDIVLFFSSALTSDVPEMSVLNLPFLFRNPEHMMNVLNGEVGQDLQTLLQNKGYTVLAWYDGGSRSFYSRNKLLPYASDFKGQKIRVPNKPELLSMVKALGATASTMAFDKLPGALKSGDLDIAENDFTSYYTSEHYKIAPYYTFSYHSVQPIAMLISAQRWKSLSEADRAIFRQSAQESSVQAAKIRSKQDAEIRAKLEKAGVKFSDFRGATTAISLMKSTYEPIVVSPQATSLMVKIMTGTTVK